MGLFRLENRVVTSSILFTLALSPVACGEALREHTDVAAVRSGEASPPEVRSVQGIKTLTLRGSRQEMGQQYGAALRSELRQALAILEDYYVKQRGVPFTRLQAQAELFYDRFPWSYQMFILGVAQGSGLRPDQAKILNAQETLTGLSRDDPGACSFIAISPSRTKTGAMLIGRNYDFPPPYDRIAPLLTVTVMEEDNSLPVAFIGLPGQIYCPTCIGGNGIFMELNNGMPSGGFSVNTKRQTLLITMLQALQDSDDLAQVESRLNATQSDYSLIVNIANKNTLKSLEFSSTKGQKTTVPTDDIFVSTNFFLNEDWPGLPEPTDATTWQGVTRRNNLLKLARHAGPLDAEGLSQIMNRTIPQGGAVSPNTIYQLIYDSHDGSLLVRVAQSSDWIAIPELF
jgi:hypothetical protein